MNSSIMRESILRFILLPSFFLFLITSIAFAEDFSFISFSPIAKASNNFILGVSELKGSSGYQQALSLKHLDTVYAVLPLDSNSKRVTSVLVEGLALYANKLVMRATLSYSFDNSSNNSSMQESLGILFGLDNSTASLLDVISLMHASSDIISRFDILLPTVEAPSKLSRIVGLSSKQSEGKLLLDFFDYSFYLLADISKNKFSVENKSIFYNKRFQEVAFIKDRDEYQSFQYYIYGVLASKFSTDWALNDNKEKFNASNSYAEDLLNSMILLKQFSIKSGVVSLLTSYLENNLQKDELLSSFEDENDRTAFEEELNRVEQNFNKLRLDELVFNDFISYLNNSLTMQELSQYIVLSLPNRLLQLEPILQNVLQLNSTFHNNSFRLLKLKTS